MSVLSPLGRFAAILFVGLASVGCSTTTGAKSSWLPWASSAAPKADAMGATTGNLSDTSRGIVGQWNTMTAAAGSALSKTTSAVTGVFSTSAANPTSKDDPTALSTKIESIGPEVYIAYGQVCEGTGKFGDAMENYEKALKIAPTNGPALASVARLHDRQNNHAQAIEFYQKAITSSPNDAQLYSDLGMLYARIGQVEQGSKKLEQAIAIRPSEAKYHSNLAAVQLDSGNSAKALETLQKANTPAAANYNMALLLVQRNQIQNAQQHLAVALQQDPNMQPARDLMTKLGGAQAVQQTYNAYQTANNVYQGVRDLSNMAPAGSANVAPSQTMPAGFQPNTSPAVQGAAPLTNLPAIPYVPSLEAGAGSSFR